MIIRRSKSGRRWSTICVGPCTVKSSAFLFLLHHRRQVGDLLYRLTSDTYAIQTLTMNGLFPVLCSLTLFVGMFLVMIRMDPPSLFLALIICPILFVFVMISPLGGWLVSSATRMHQQKSSVFSLVQGQAGSPCYSSVYERRRGTRRFMALSQKSLKAELHFYLLQNFLFRNRKCRHRDRDRGCHLGGCPVMPSPVRLTIRH